MRRLWRVLKEEVHSLISDAKGLFTVKFFDVPLWVWYVVILPLLAIGSAVRAVVKWTKRRVQP